MAGGAGPGRRLAWRVADTVVCGGPRPGPAEVVATTQIQPRGWSKGSGQLGELVPDHPAAGVGPATVVWDQSQQQ